jgi:hypothetical protein
MRHKHADVIIAWAEGKTVQLLLDCGWTDILSIHNPLWTDDIEYRVKPEEVVTYTAIDNQNIPGGTFFYSTEDVEKNYLRTGGYLPNTYLQRTTVDGKVVDFKLIHKEQ